MNLRPVIKKALNHLGFHVSRVGKRHQIQSTLSPNLSMKVELDGDMTEMPTNDLGRFFSGNQSKDLHKWHHYFEIYDHWFARYRGRPDLRVLEIGVFRGGSLRMWREYFDGDATIVGLDIDDKCKTYEKAESKCFVEIGDQADVSFLESVVRRHGPFDIIIDDGGHMTMQQITSFNFLYADGLKDGGLYVVEDLHSNYWAEYKDAAQSFVEFAKTLLDHLHEPYFENQSELKFRIGAAEQVHSLKVSYFCANTQSISFYDSMIVLAKRRKLMPVSEIR